jgi:hypothetical protein
MWYSLAPDSSRSKVERELAFNGVNRPSFQRHK